MTVSRAALHRLGGEGPPLLLVHGFGADRFGWAANAHALMAGRTVWAAELPGHGASGNAVGQGTAAELAQGLAAGIADLPEGVPVVAHSLGAAVVLHLAARQRARFGELVLIAPVGLGAGFDAAFARDLAAVQTTAEAEALLARLFARPARVAPMAAHLLAGLGDPARRAAHARIARAMGDAPPPPAPAGSCALHLVWGAEDRIVPPPAAAPFGVAPEIIAGAGHLPQIEAAGTLNALLRARLG
jgi:pyruvate dehydrogenase E2 component (dihydrolipoamide acetyltransferase)